MHFGVLLVYLLRGLVLVHCEVEYSYINQRVTWADARQHCREHYTDLATLENAEDVHRLKIPYNTWAWIGLFDDPASWKGAMTADSNSWRWSATGTTSPGGFQNWRSGDPNKYGGMELCVYIQNGLWLDYRCATSLHFMCYTVQTSGTKKYILIRTAMTWTSSQAYCRQHHHDLATIENSAENQAVTDLLPSTTSSVWIGLYRDPWRWSDGNRSTYKKWLSEGPNNYGGSEFCVTQHSDYVWNDAPCHYMYGFVCHAVKRSNFKEKITFKTTADMSEPMIRDKFLKALENHLGLGLSLRWDVPPIKVEGMEANSDNNRCPAPRKAE